MAITCPTHITLMILLLLMVTVYCLENECSSVQRTVYIAPESYFQLNTSILEESICCYYHDYFQKRGNEQSTWSIRGRERTIISSGEYDSNKYQIKTIIGSKSESFDFLAPQEQFRMDISYSSVLSKDLITLHCSKESDDARCKKKESTEYLTFRYPITIFYGVSEFSSVRIGAVQFQLHIMNASTEDDGIYTCKVKGFSVELSRLRFLNHTKDNIIYGQEGMTCNISCATVKGYNAGELAILQNDKILASSNNSIVTFSFIPKQHDNFTKYRCVGKDPTLADVQVQFALSFAPDVEVVVSVNNIDCFANGYPKTYTFYEWEHQSEQGNHVRFLEGIQNGTLNLQTLPQQYQIGGKYICSVSNGIPGLNGSTIQKGFESLSFIGPPIFAQENNNKQEGSLREPLILSFLLYSNPIVENIWIEGNGTLAYQIHDYRISKAHLLYTGSISKGHISGYEISFETNVFTNSNTNAYTIWAGNTFGVDFYQLKIIEIEPPQCKTKTKKQFIASCGIVAGLLVYLIISQVCFYKSVRKKQIMERNIPHDLNIHNYDEIGPIAYQYVNRRPSDTDHQELIQQTSFAHILQAQSSIINGRHFLSMNESTVESNGISESSDNESQQVFIPEAASNTTLATTDEQMIQCVGISSYQTSASSGIDNVDNTLRSNQSRIHQDEHSSNINRSSTSSTSSDESRIDYNGAALSRVIISDGYENPQIVMQVNQEPHEYTCITQPEKIDIANQLHNTDDLQGISNDQNTATSELDQVDITLRLNQSGIHQEEHSLKSNRGSTSSTSSNESRMDSNDATLNRVIVSGGYENPYQIVMPVNQDPHEYTAVTEPEQINDANQSQKTDKLQEIFSVQTTASHDVNNVDNTLLLNPGRMNQIEHSLNSNKRSTSSTYSTSSNESRMDSNGATLNRVIVSDGYENPYQIVLQVNQDPHEYTVITQPEQIDDVDQSHTTDELKREMKEYVNLRLQ